MSHLWKSFILIAGCCLGCQQAESVSTDGDSPTELQNHEPAENESQLTHNGSATVKSTQQDRKDITISRDDLKSYLETFPDESGWQFEERYPGELVGTWISQDEDKEVVVFHPDGTFAEDLNGKLTSGYFAISESGRIVALSSWRDVRLGSHFQLKGDTLVGAKGPSPMVEWKREVDKTN